MFYLGDGFLQQIRHIFAIAGLLKWKGQLDSPKKK